ncbi:MAG: isochorismatase family protein [Fretibacterium sp.]|nr:isochorismatase family protein [Fretibacterium sp.]
MPKWNSQNTCMLLVDIQEKLLPVITGHETVLLNSIRLLKAARIFQTPLLVTEQYPKGIGPTVAALKELFPAGTPTPTKILSKTTFSCCGAPGFSEALDSLNRPFTILFGIETHICLLATLEELQAEGRNVLLAADACGSRNPEHHALALDAARACGAAVLPTETLIYRMLGDSARPEFKELLPLFK